MSSRPVGIIGAMEEEVARLKNDMADVRVTDRAGMAFCSGRLAGRDVVVVRSGICKVNAGLCTQILADVFDVAAVLNTGIAGCLDAAVAIGDLVISTDAVQHDVHAEIWGYAPGEIPRTGKQAFAADPGLVALAEAVCREALPQIGCHAGRVLSGDCFVSDGAVREQLRATYGGLCVEMEGAAIAQAACANDIPWVVLRAISDQADGSATADYKQFEEQAIDNGVTLVKEMLSRM